MYCSLEGSIKNSRNAADVNSFRVASLAVEGGLRSQYRVARANSMSKRFQSSLEASSIRLRRTPEAVPADENAAEFQERFVNVGPPIEANAKTTEVVEPRVSPRGPDAVDERAGDRD